MKILVVQESDWIEKGPHQSHHLMERLSERGHQIRVIDFEISWRQNGRTQIFSKTESISDFRKATTNGHVDIIRPSMLRIPYFEYAWEFWAHNKELVRQLDSFKPDIIVCFGILNAWSAIRIAKRRNIPIIYYIIDELHRLVPQSHLRGIARLIEKYNMKMATRVVSINENLRRYTVAMGAEESRSLVIRAGIDLDRFNPRVDGSMIRDDKGFKDRDIVLFFMGWLYSFSGLLEVVKFILDSSKSKREIKLMIIGKGELWNDIQEIIQKRDDRNRIILIDWMPYDRMPAFIAASDICILPSHKNEIMQNIVPIKLYEYLAMGKPVIATRLPGIVTEFGEFSGITYVDEQQDVIPTAIDIVESRYEEESKRGILNTRDNSWEEITNQFEKFAHELIYTNDQNRKS